MFNFKSLRSNDREKAVNVGEIIAIIIPVLNKNAGPKHSKAQERADKCGLSSRE